MYHVLNVRQKLYFMSLSLLNAMSACKSQSFVFILAICSRKEDDRILDLGRCAKPQLYYANLRTSNFLLILLDSFILRVINMNADVYLPI